jgi:hypothetical protein
MAQPAEEGAWTVKERVLDALFSVEESNAPYFRKLTLRYGDTDTQLTVLTYPAYPRRPAGQAEVIKYTVEGVEPGHLVQLVQREIVLRRDVTALAIAAKLKVHVSRFPLDEQSVERSLKELSAIRLSPILQTSVAVDDYSRYQLWFDTGQESVHYRLTGPFSTRPQDQLVEWMVSFRAKLPGLLRK